MALLNIPRRAAHVVAITILSLIVFLQTRENLQTLLSQNVEKSVPQQFLNPRSALPSTPLPCVEEFRQSILDDSKLRNYTKEELLSKLSLLTYENRKKWVSRLNPLIIRDSHQLSKIRNVCPVGSIALVVITSGLIPNIQEWLAHHLLMGVQTILLFDDSVPASPEQQSFHKAIQIFVEQGYVIVQNVTRVGDFVSTEAHINNLVLREYGTQYDWIGFIGNDEFITLHQDKCLKSFLSSYTDFGGVVLEWRVFSHVDVSTHDITRTHFEQYQYLLRRESPLPVKTILQPKYTQNMTLHFANYIPSRWAVNFRKDRVDGPFNVHLKPEEEFAVAELRHFYMGDTLHALFEKACGLNDQRIQYRVIRIEQFKDPFRENRTEKATDFLLPLIHDDLKEFMFQKRSEHLFPLHLWHFVPMVVIVLLVVKMRVRTAIQIF